jgi:hypothetical protein
MLSLRVRPSRCRLAAARRSVYRQAVLPLGFKFETDAVLVCRFAVGPDRLRRADSDAFDGQVGDEPLGHSALLVATQLGASAFEKV